MAEAVPRVLGSRWGLGVALLAGAAMPLGFAPFNQWLVPVVALAVLFAIVTVAPTRRALGASYLFGIAYVALSCYWIYISVSHYGGGVFAGVLVTMLLTLIAALYPLLACALGKYLGRGNRCRTLVLALPLAWVLIEWIRSWLFSGTTWLTVGYTQIDGPLSGIAPVFGTYGISLAVVLIAGSLAGVVLRPARTWLMVFVVTLGVSLLGGWGLDRSWTAPQGEPIRVALVQGDFAQEQKWLPQHRLATLERYRHLTERHFGADLVIWPETAVPAYYHEVSAAYLDPLAREAARYGTTILTGVPVVDPVRNIAFNAVARLGVPPAFYYKRHLVPFGEYVPFRAVFGNTLDVLGAPMGDFAAGESSTLLLVAGQRIGVSICYEITFGKAIAAALPAADLLVNVSNDAWFGDSLAPYQHLEMARMRARETQRYLLRATNTGLTSIIDARGRVREHGPLFQPVVVTGQAQPRIGATPYVIWTDYPVVAGVLFGLAGSALWPRRRADGFSR
ncbi:apolipoprotein N-acyltransferase [Nitrococcus mobilis]|uniref:Apolipoprotein N-acyltransferase n=1 Tax=Nitrococcus mobilis Nb-231 TaxID=314278 RepID=A4BQ71_9GAMM|nr:apolipoprotein N-acyltransferase [Nitrococcus mobilis]EAR22226.1 apolipoprotein N-acyltransferase [Nitrococcus mobilis Nb-231]